MVCRGHPFRMPLYSDHRCGKVCNGFYDMIRTSLNNLQIFTGHLDTLVMIAVDHHMWTEKGMQKRTGQIFGRMKNICVRVLVQLSVGNFSDGTMKIQIDQLHSLADAYNGLTCAEE